MRLNSFLSTFLLLSIGGSLSAGALNRSQRLQVPVYFEKNVGQVDLKVAFVAHTPTARVFLTRQGATFLPLGVDRPIPTQLTFKGSSAPRSMRGRKPRKAVSRYVSPSGESIAPHYAEVQAEGIYPGIDVLYHGDPQRFEYDFIVRPKADPSLIQMRITGSKQVELSAAGELIAGGLRFEKPVAFQHVDGVRKVVSAEYVLSSDGLVSFQLGDYDSSLPLIIDPVVEYATYLGGAGADVAADVVVNSRGEAHVVGISRSLNFPVSPGAAQPNFRGGGCSSGIAPVACFDIVVAKLNASGTGLVYATYFGGSGDDRPADADLDSDGNLYITGTTESADWPLTIASDAPAGRDPRRGDAFLLRLNPDGSVGSSAVAAGSEGESGLGVAAVGLGAVVVGHTRSSDFPVSSDAGQKTKAGDSDRIDAFIAIFSADGARLRSTYLGGSLDDSATSVDASPDGRRIVVTGWTASSDFPDPSGSQTGLTAAKADAFIANFTSELRLANASLYGGSEADAGVEVEIGPAGLATIIGSTQSRDLPTTPRSVLPIWKRSQGFLARFAPGQTRLEYATYVLGSADDLAVDPAGNMYVAGKVNSTSPLFGRPIQPGCDGSLLRKISPDGQRMTFSGFVPGLGSIDSASSDTVYSAGTDVTGSLTTTAGAPQANHAGQADVYVTKLSVLEDDQISITCVENAGSYFAGELSPGQIVSVFGSGLGRHLPAGLIVRDGLVTTEIDRIRVLFDGTPGAMLFTHWNQINVVAPYSIEGRDTVSIQVEKDGVLSDPFEVPVADAHPGLFTIDSTGSGIGAILNEDGTRNTGQNPAPAGSLVTLFGTGEGATSPAGIDGLVAPMTVDSLPRPVQAVGVRIAGRVAEVTFAGGAPGLVSGVLQLNVRIPPGTPPGPALVVVTIGGRSNRQPVTVIVQ